MNLQFLATAAKGVAGWIAAAELFVVKFVEAMETLVLVNDGAGGLLGVELMITLLLGWSGCCCWLSNTDDIVEFVDVWLVNVVVLKLASLARTAVGLTTGCCEGEVTEKY